MNELLQQASPEARAVGSPRGPAIELNHILVPVDFSAASRNGLRFALNVAERFHSRLDLLYAVEPPSLPEWGYAHLPKREAKLWCMAEKRLPDFASECGLPISPIRSMRVTSGNADLEICKAAAEAQAELIVMASHGRGGLSHVFIGSTVERVVRHSPCPVLAFRDRALRGDRGKLSFGLRRILVTTDFSEASKKSFPYALALARKFEASLTLLYVVPSHLPAEIGQIGLVLEEKRLTERARSELPRFRAAELDPHLKIETLVLNGGVAHEICTIAETRAIDLIAISTHGHTGLKHFLLGSVTENVLRHAPCPVLVVREREHDFLNLNNASRL